MQSGIEHGAAARGSLYSGGTNLDLAAGLNGLASQNYNNWFGQNMGLAQMGQQSTNSLGGYGANAANNTAQLYSDNGLNKAGKYSSYANNANKFVDNISDMAGSFFGMGG